MDLAISSKFQAFDFHSEMHKKHNSCLKGREQI